MDKLQAYRVTEANENAKKLAEKITALIIESAVTYQEAEDALELTQTQLMCETRPVKL